LTVDFSTFSKSTGSWERGWFLHAKEVPKGVSMVAQHGARKNFGFCSCLVAHENDILLAKYLWIGRSSSTPIAIVVCLVCCLAQNLACEFVSPRVSASE